MSKALLNPTNEYTFAAHLNILLYLLIYKKFYTKHLKP